MMRSFALALPVLALMGPVHAADTVYVPGHRTWTNSWVPPHYAAKPAAPRYGATGNQPLESLVEPKKPAQTPPMSIYTPAPQYDPYYNALNAASRPQTFAKPPADRR